MSDEFNKATFPPTGSFGPLRPFRKWNGKPLPLPLTHMGASIEFPATYDPIVTNEIMEALDKAPKDIEVTFLELLWVASPGVRVEIVKSRVKFKGYLSKFRPNDAKEGESPTAVMEITPIHNATTLPKEDWIGERPFKEKP